MSGLSDLEICKRIAKIEGVEICGEGHKKKVLKSLYTVADQSKIKTFELFVDYIIEKGIDGLKYNPLTDDALCFQLMVKYQVGVDFVRPKETDIGGVFFQKFRGKPNKAICLSIIKSRGDM